MNQTNFQWMTDGCCEVLDFPLGDFHHKQTVSLSELNHLYKQWAEERSGPPTGFSIITRTAIVLLCCYHY